MEVRGKLESVAIRKVWKLETAKFVDIYRIGRQPFIVVDFETKREELGYEILSHQ